jgi:hypothetical protein
MNEKIDALGRKLNVGDTVIYTCSYMGLYSGKVTKICDTIIKVDGSRQYPQDVLLLNAQEAEEFKNRRKIK